MSTATEALGLAQYFIDEIDKLPSDRDSSWVASADAAKAAGVPEDELKKVRQRVRFKEMLEKAGIHCSCRGKFFYVTRESLWTPAD